MRKSYTHTRAHVRQHRGEEYCMEKTSKGENCNKSMVLEKMGLLFAYYHSFTSH